MRFEKLKISKRDLGKILPPGICMEIDTLTPVIYGAVDDTGVIGGAVFTVPPKAPAAVRLHYVAVSPTLRGKGLGTALIDFGCQAVKKAGAEVVLYRKVEREADALIAALSFLSKSGFSPLVPESELFTYSRDAIRQNKYIREFHQKLKETEGITEENPMGALLDADFCRFYADETGRTGVIATMYQNTLFVIRQVLTETTFEMRKRILPLLLVSCLEEGLRVKTVADFCITLSDVFDRKMLEKLFGEPESVYRAIDLIKYL